MPVFWSVSVSVYYFDEADKNLNAEFRPNPPSLPVPVFLSPCPCLCDCVCLCLWLCVSPTLSLKPRGTSDQQVSHMPGGPVVREEDV